MDVKQLVENSVKLYVENPEDFLNKFTPETFNNKITISEIKKILQNSKKIGEKSGFGEIYSFKLPNSDSSLVIKTVKNCPDSQDKNHLVKSLCEIAEKGDIVYHIPNTYTGKTLIYAPNYLTENLIGIILSKDTEKYTSSFMKIYGFQYDRSDPAKITYSVNEPLINYTEYIRSDDDYLYFIFRIVHGLGVAQKLGRYVHYDLHENNIMSRKTDEMLSVIPLSNGEFLYSYFDFDPVIIDYGFNRYELKNTILSPRAKMDEGVDDNMDNYFYNPYYDLYTFLLTSRSPMSDKQTSQSVYKNWNVNKNLVNYMFKTFVNVPLSDVTDADTFIENFLEYASYNKWRPLPERLTTELVKYKWHRVLNVDEFLVKLVSKIKSTRSEPYPIYSNDNQLPDILNYIKRNKFWVSPHLVNFDRLKIYDKVPTSKILKSVNYHYRSIDNFETKNYNDSIKFGDKNIIEINSKNRLSSYVDPEIRKYHYQITKQMREQDTFDISLDSPWIHLALIDQDLGKKCGYKFRFDCCRVDIRNYFQTETIKAGVAINAAFFKIKENFAPVGFFKTNDYESNVEIPSVYKKYYGIVGIDKEGKLHVDKTVYANEYQHVLTCGPLLVWKGEKSITSDDLYYEIIPSRKEEEYIWECRDPGKAEENLKIFKDGTSNCKKIEPGELSHGANPNPRSAIFVTHEGKVGMLYVEGRDQKGPGLDFSQLADLCLHHGAKFAINLDGGRSSQLLWKKQGEDLIHQSNLNNLISYPVGSVISFVLE
jgi:hypothetical protein